MSKYGYETAHIEVAMACLACREEYSNDTTQPFSMVGIITFANEHRTCGR